MAPILNTFKLLLDLFTPGDPPLETKELVVDVPPKEVWPDTQWSFRELSVPEPAEE